MSQVGWSRIEQDFFMLLKTVHDLKLMNFFRNFPLDVFRLWLAASKTAETKTTDKRELLQSR